MTRPARVLVVDDDSGIRGMLELALGSAGYAVRTSDGTAVGSLDDVDVVLLDVRLGPEAAVDAAAFRDTRAAVIVMTAGADGRRVATEVGAVARLAKPFDLADVFRLIELALAKRDGDEGRHG